MKEREKWSERVRREWREVGRKGRSCFSRIQLALASIKDVRAAFSPGEELDDGIAQELQSLVVIDPGQDEGEETEEGGGWEGGRGGDVRAVGRKMHFRQTAAHVQ